MSNKIELITCREDYLPQIAIDIIGSNTTIPICITDAEHANYQIVIDDGALTYSGVPINPELIEHIVQEVFSKYPSLEKSSAIFSYQYKEFNADAIKYWFDIMPDLSLRSNMPISEDAGAFLRAFGRGMIAASPPKEPSHG